MAPVTRREHFAALGRLSMATRTVEERSRFARIGSLTAARNGKQHRWTSSTARSAGRKGGVASGVARKAKTSGQTVAHGLWRKRDDRELDDLSDRLSRRRG
jgi:hypothetical protein